MGLLQVTLRTIRQNLQRGIKENGQIKLKFLLEKSVVVCGQRPSVKFSQISGRAQKIFVINGYLLASN